METIKKRSIIQFALLDILTFGIYGIIACNSMGRDIDKACEGDGEKEISYIKAWLLGLITLRIYEEYWWYRQANRMKYNAGRYNLEIRESGLSLLAFRATGRTLGFIFTIIKLISTFGSVLISMLPFSYMFGLGYSYESVSPFSIFAGGFFGILSALFTAWIQRACEKLFVYIGLSFVMKNLNRYSDAYETYEALDFDPMGYEYYNASCNFPANKEVVVEEKRDTDIIEGKGKLTGMKGTNAGYVFNLKDGEEIIIGKSPQFANIIIDAKYADVSRKHCGITYLAKTDEYMVTDYSQNGVYDGSGIQLSPGSATRMPAGTVITLAKTNNQFRLG